MEHDKKVSVVKNNFSMKLKKFFFGNKTRAITTAAFFLLVLIGGWQLLGSSKKQPQYQTAQVTRQTIISTVSESGNVASGSQAGVGSPTTGIVTDMYVKDGDTVVQGQNLFKVKSTATAQEIASAYANYLSAQNTLNSAKAQMNSLQQALFKANQAFITDRGVNNPTAQQQADPVYIEENAAWLQAQANYTNQQGVINQAQAALSNASLAYQATQDSIVTAPISGTVVNIGVQPGDQIVASSGNLSTELTSNSSSSSNNPVLEIGNFGSPYIKVSASEVDIPTIHAGQKATITLSAFPNETFAGKIEQVDTVGTISSGVVSYTVFVRFIAPPSTVQPGMSATVTIETARHDNVLSVPSSAVQTSSSGTTVVRILQNGQIISVPVTTGIASDTDTEITSGLSEGQTVITNIVLPSNASSTSSTTSPFSGLGGRGFGGGAVIRTGGTGAGRGGQ